MRNPFVKQRGSEVKKGSGKATYESVSRYLRVLGVELPAATMSNGCTAKPGEEHVRFITRMGEEEGLFISVNLDAAEAWFDEWCRQHPFASNEDLRGASWAAYLLNTVDIDLRPRGARSGFFRLDGRGNLTVPPGGPGHEPPSAESARQSQGVLGMKPVVASKPPPSVAPPRNRLRPPTALVDL